MELNNPMNDHHRILLCRARTKKGLLSLRHPSADEFESLKILIYNPESVIRRPYPCEPSNPPKMWCEDRIEVTAELDYGMTPATCTP